MAASRIEEIVAGMTAPIVEKLSFELVDTEFIKEGANWYLRVYIDKPGGISLDNCQAVSEELSDLLDKADPIKQPYILEVSSPGLDRPLKKDSDYEKYKGVEIEVKLYKALDGKKSFTGELLGLRENRIVIKQTGGITLEFERKDVSSARRVIKF